LFVKNIKQISPVKQPKLIGRTKWRDPIFTSKLQSAVSKTSRQKNWRRLSRNKGKERKAVKQEERKRQCGSWTSASDELLLKINSNNSMIDDDFYVICNEYFYTKDS
jgi:hypothetical protein